MIFPCFFHIDFSKLGISKFSKVISTYRIKTRVQMTTQKSQKIQDFQNYVISEKLKERKEENVVIDVETIRFYF